MHTNNCCYCYMIRPIECELQQIISMVCEFTFCNICILLFYLYALCLGPEVFDPRQVVCYDC